MAVLPVTPYCGAPHNPARRGEKESEGKRKAQGGEVKSWRGEIELRAPRDIEKSRIQERRIILSWAVLHRRSDQRKRTCEFLCAKPLRNFVARFFCSFSSASIVGVDASGKNGVVFGVDEWLRVAKVMGDRGSHWWKDFSYFQASSLQEENGPTVELGFIWRTCRVVKGTFNWWLFFVDWRIFLSLNPWQISWINRVRRITSGLMSRGNYLEYFCRICEMGCCMKFDDRVWRC